MPKDPFTPSSKPSARTVHYVLSSHWDREWYQTFQDFRRRLVRLLDRVMDELQTGEMRGPFTTDGQSIILDDYLEIRPHRRQQIEEFAKSAKLKIGPWYVLPDEWLVSGESLVRNLALGRRSARQFGGDPSNAGFVCDLFGHISQLPQIFNGFGIQAALIWRGLEPRPSAHIIWEGADGSRLVCYRFGRAGYGDYSFDVRHCTEPDHRFETEAARNDLEHFLEKEAARTSIPPMIVFDGGDHLEPDPSHYQMLLAIESREDSPYVIIHSTLDAYLEEVLVHKEAIAEFVKGELRQPGLSPVNEDQQWLIPGVLSSRVWIKQANAECQTLLCSWAEPFASLTTAILGNDYPTSYLDLAWRWLLQNHPHDSICGCSIDEVHEDMKYRFAQCRQIATAQTNESLRTLAAAVEGLIEQNELRILVANALPSLLDEPVVLTLELPEEWGCYNEFFGFEPKPGFRIFCHTGEELPYQLVAQDMARAKTRTHPLKFPSAHKTNDVTVCVNLALPAMGYTTLTVREGKQAPGKGVVPAQTLPTRHPQEPSLVTSERSMENEFLSVTIESNGTLTIIDKRTEQTYSRLLTFEDSADIGDGWYHGPVVNDQRFVSSSARSDLALISEGPLFCQFRIRTEVLLPKEFDFSVKRRSPELSPLVVDSLLTLRKGCDRIEVQSTVENTVKDHRFRVLFPSGTSANTYFSDTPFDAVEREIALPADNNLGRELAVETTPQQSWTAVTGGGRGLAIVSSGLMESTVRDLPDRPIALTLFRSTRRTVLTDGQPEGQLIGPMRFNYWIVPLADNFNRRQLFDLGSQLAAGVRVAQLRHWDYPSARHKGILPAESCLFEVSGDAVTTSVRYVQGQLEVRLFNPTNEACRSVLQLNPVLLDDNKIKSFVRVDFESQHIGEAQPARSDIPLTLHPKEILTLRFAGAID